MSACRQNGRDALIWANFESLRETEAKLQSLGIRLLGSICGRSQCKKRFYDKAFRHLDLDATFRQGPFTTFREFMGLNCCDSCFHDEMVSMQGGYCGECDGCLKYRNDAQTNQHEVRAAPHAD